MTSKTVGWTVLGLWMLVSCTTPEVPNVVDNPLPACHDYAKDANIYGYCVYKNADSLPSVDSVNLYCAQAGAWAQDCRQTWVISQSKDTPFDALMGVCGQNSDCAFQLLDKRPQEDVLNQVDFCMRYAGHYKHDCVMHAIQRWYFEWPDAEEVSRVAKERNPFPEQIGTYIGARVGCDNVGSCEGNADNQMMCEKYVRIYQQDSRQCPNQHRRRRKRSP